MKRSIAAFLTAGLTAGAVFGIGSAAMAAPTPTSSGHSSTVANGDDAQAAAVQEALATAHERVEPVAVRVTDAGIERDFAIGENSIFTITDSRGDGVADERDDTLTPQLGAGSDRYGFYIDLSPADQNSWINGGSTLILAGMGALMGPGGALALGVLGAFIGPQLAQGTCAANNQTARFYYTLDGNAQSVRCI